MKSTGTVPLDTWTYVTWVYSSGTVYFYINGHAAGSASQASGAANSKNVFIGTDNADSGPGSSSNYFDGSIADVQIYNTSISANDVTALFQEGIGGIPQNTQNLVGWWPLNGNTDDCPYNLNNRVHTDLNHLRLQRNPVNFILGGMSI